jgi:AcrR family transcriptional regulator
MLPDSGGYSEDIVSNKGQDVKERILEHSMRLFLANGFVGTSVKDLTDAVGIARGTLYWHFSGKDQILDEILNRYSEQFIDGTIEAVNRCEGDFLTKFHALYRFITEFTRDNRELLIVFDTLLGEISRNGTNAANKMKEIRSRLRLSIEALLSTGQKEGAVGKDIDISLHAHIIIAILAGMLIEWFVYEESLDAVAYSRAFRKVILSGLRSEKGNDGRTSATSAAASKRLKTRQGNKQ